MASSSVALRTAGGAAAAAAAGLACACAFGDALAQARPAGEAHPAQANLTRVWVVGHSGTGKTTTARLLAEKLAGRKRELPIKVFRMMDVDRSGTLSKKECIRAFRIMGLGHYSGPLATMDKRRRLQQSWDKIDPKGRGELVLEQFRQLLVIMLPDEDQALLFVDVITRSYISIVAAGFFLAFCMCSTAMFVYLKRDEGWTVLDSLYFTTMTFLT